MPNAFSLVDRFASLTAVLHERARGDRSLTHIFGEHDEHVVSYSELHKRALGILHFLQAQGVKPGDHLVLYCKDNEQFVDAFWACIYGGIVPVPVAVGISDEHRRKLLRIVALLDNAWLYTEEALYNRLVLFAGDESSDLGGRCGDVFDLIVVESVAPRFECSAAVTLHVDCRHTSPVVGL